LFNNISVLTGLIEENPKRAVEFSEKLATIYRYFLDQENQELVLLDDELSFGKQYMDLLQVRYENALQVSNKLKNTSDYYILPLALQQVFENIIKHNEITTECPMKVTVICKEDYLIVENSLNLKTRVDSKLKTGLDNIKKRYSYFTDRLIQESLDANSYSIKLPLLKVEK
jgi:LytS/YehU family sensor histidine kinase